MLHLALRTITNSHIRNKDYLSAPLENHQEFLLSRTHKRALSAPDFPAPPKTFTMAYPKAEPTPPSSHHPDHASPRTLNHPAPDTPPTASEAENQPVVCMYIPNCDTGSQPRKAISHIFGRNKMCTRLIPQSVWVHYCRKHYQRSRYRNPKEYAKLQCDLVQQQIRRVHDWSLANMKNGAPGIVQDWGLAVRKREQKRLDDLGGAKRKRSAATLTMIVMMERTEMMEVEATQSRQPLYLNGFWRCVERAIIPSRSWRFSIACIPRFLKTHSLAFQISRFSPTLSSTPMSQSLPRVTQREYRLSTHTSDRNP